jgi:hypothetical protein
MHACSILHRCLARVFVPMHAARRNRLLGAVEAFVAGRRLTLTDLARSWPGATWMHAPLKALDRLLGNRHLHAEVDRLYSAMAVWLLRGMRRPWVLVDWSDLKGDGRWSLLRASVPVGGRALTLFELVYPLQRMGQPRAQVEFLRHLARILPPGVAPIIVTDAGFRSEWLRATQAMGWDYVARVRNTTKVMAPDQTQWQACTSLHSRATLKPRELGAYAMVKGDPMTTRLVLNRRVRKGRDKLTRQGLPEQGRTARKARKAAREPWLLATSLDPKTYPAHVIVKAYSRRMQIEEAFRDLKSHRYGAGFEDSLTRKPERLMVLLMLHALATLAAWLMGLAASGHTQQDPLARQSTHHHRYSLIRRGIEWLRRVELPAHIRTRLRRPAMQAQAWASVES